MLKTEKHSIESYIEKQSIESLPQPVVQERHLVDKNVIGVSKSDDQRESVSVLNASPVATQSASRCTRCTEET